MTVDEEALLAPADDLATREPTARPAFSVRHAGPVGAIDRVEDWLSSDERLAGTVTRPHALLHELLVGADAQAHLAAGPEQQHLRPPARGVGEDVRAARDS